MALSFFPRLYFQNSPIVRGKTPTLATGSGFFPSQLGYFESTVAGKMLHCVTLVRCTLFTYEYNISRALSLSLSLSLSDTLALSRALSLSLSSLSHTRSLSLSLGHTLSLSTFASLSSSRAPHNHTI